MFTQQFLMFVEKLQKLSLEWSIVESQDRGPSGRITRDYSPRASRECISPPPNGGHGPLALGPTPKGVPQQRVHGSHGTPKGRRAALVSCGLPSSAVDRGSRPPWPPPNPRASFWLVLLANLLILWNRLHVSCSLCFYILPCCYSNMHVFFFGGSSFRGITRFK